MKDTFGIFLFFLKSAIVAILVLMVAKLILPDTKALRSQWKEFSSQRENQALVFSFIQNPVALTTSGERDYELQKYADAALKFELAVGLLEMHGASHETIAPYQVRLDKARKLAALPPTK